jgi:ubiquinone/menaquinone biosynthesis C-methylase UbiE
MLDLTVQSYDKTAQEYTENVKGLTMEKEMSEFLPFIQGSKLILDIGCGSGRDVKKIIKNGYKAIGLDPSKELLKIAKQETTETTFIQAYAQNLPFRNQTFEGIWSCSTLIHIPKKDISSTLREIYRTLKPGAFFYSDFKQGEGEKLLEDKRYNNVKKLWSFYQKSEIEQALNETGFKIIKQWGKDINNPYATNTWIMFLSNKPK